MIRGRDKSKRKGKMKNEQNGKKTDLKNYSYRRLCERTRGFCF